MAQIPFYIVDVFARDRYTGNPLAVVLTADALSDREMQQIAQEMNYSETTFVSPNISADRGYNVRIFTPEIELPFAGHPTLGTAYIIKNFILQDTQTRQLLLNLKSGQIPVSFKPNTTEREEVWMQQNAPQFTETFTPEEMAAVLSLDADEIDVRFPIQAVSTGVSFAIVPLKSLAAVKKARLNRDRYFPWQNTTAAQGILLFCPETYHAENDLNVRVFAEAVGVPEDPATGSANGCLAAYLVQHQYWGHPHLKARVEQGYEIKRPSLLLLQASLSNSTWEILVGGAVILVARGDLFST